MRDPASYRDLARRCRRLSKGTEDLDLLDQLETWAMECDGGAVDALLDSPKQELLEQAGRHRLRAEEYRVVAEQMHSPAARALLQHLAHLYEAMARQLEDNANRLGRGRRNSG